MKRGLVFTLCALAAMASATVGHAQTIDLTLNLRFNDPADPTEGGVWYLLGKTTGGASNLGIAGVSVFLQNVNASASHGNGVALGAGQNPLFHAYPTVGQATINNLTNGANPYNGPFQVGTPTVTGQNVLYGQDLSIAGIISGVGQGSGAHNVPLDPLKNPTYDNYSLLLSGSFAGGSTAATLPRFVPGATQGGNVLTSTTPGTPAALATITTHVRGDSLGTLNLNSVAGAGLRGGDANRDGLVNVADFGVLQTNVGSGGRTWDQADFNDDGNTNVADFGIIQTNVGASTPPSFAAVPEPASLTLAGTFMIALAGLARGRRGR